MIVAWKIVEGRLHVNKIRSFRSGFFNEVKQQKDFETVWDWSEETLIYPKLGNGSFSGVVSNAIKSHPLPTHGKCVTRAKRFGWNVKRDCTEEDLDNMYFHLWRHKYIRPPERGSMFKLREMAPIKSKRSHVKKSKDVVPIQSRFMAIPSKYVSPITSSEEDDLGVE